ncbi:MAG: hypothetical protein II789_06295 [Clostridia bacterium]|nr:hypothetical protein [Clostridia bacterium]
MKKLIAVFITILISAGLAGIIAGAAAEAETEIVRNDAPYVNIDFEDAEATDDFVTDQDSIGFTNLGISYINPATYLKFTETGGISDGMMLKLLDFADIRVWALSVSGEEGYALDMTVNVESLAKDGYFELCVSDALLEESHNEGEGGFVWWLRPDENGKLSLLDHEYKVLDTLEFGRTYKITFFVESDESAYSVFVDDKLAGSSEFVGEVTNISAFRIDLRGGGVVNVDDVVLDGAWVQKKAASTPTPRVTEVPTEAPSAAPTEAPTEAATEAPTETATEAATETATEAATETATEAATEASAVTTDGVPTDVPEKPSGTEKGGFKALPVILIAAAAAVIIAAVIIILVKRQKS